MCYGGKMIKADYIAVKQVQDYEDRNRLKIGDTIGMLNAVGEVEYFLVTGFDTCKWSCNIGNSRCSGYLIITNKRDGEILRICMYSLRREYNSDEPSKTVSFIYEHIPFEFISEEDMEL